jgi:hypothetical protein
MDKPTRVRALLLSPRNRLLLVKYRNVERSLRMTGNTSSPISACSMPMRTAPTGGRSRGSCCTLMPSGSPAPGVESVRQPSRPC